MGHLGEKKMDKKICPILTAHVVTWGTTRECLEEKCALYNGKTKKCGLLADASLEKGEGGGDKDRVHAFIDNL